MRTLFLIAFFIFSIGSLFAAPLPKVIVPDDIVAREDVAAYRLGLEDANRDARARRFAADAAAMPEGVSLPTAEELQHRAWYEFHVKLALDDPIARPRRYYARGYADGAAEWIKVSLGYRVPEFWQAGF